MKELDKIYRALIEATRDLSLLRWGGTRTDSTQALSWPRQYALNPDAPSPVDPADNLVWPVYFDDDVIPQRIKDATVGPPVADTVEKVVSLEEAIFVCVER